MAHPCLSYISSNMISAPLGSHSPSSWESHKDFLRAYLPRHLPYLSLLLNIVVEQLNWNWNWNLVIFPDGQGAEGEAEEERDREGQEDGNHVARVVRISLLSTFSIKPTRGNVQGFA